MAVLDAQDLGIPIQVCVGDGLGFCQGGILARPCHQSEQGTRRVPPFCRSVRDFP